jgi:3-hydroxybutyryl-CoA dehydrogenase
MGTGIAQVAAVAGHRVVLCDDSREALENARAFHEKILSRLVEKERVSDEERAAILQRITYTSDLGGLRDASVCIEAIVEDLESKRRLFKELEKITPEGALLATNTSSLSVTSIAAACADPRLVLGIHFFNPAPLMKLVEVVPGLETPENTTEQATRLLQQWGKVTVCAKDTPGFIVNRVARPFYSEALRILDEGLANVATIDTAMTDVGGFRMGPFTLMDYIGNDINYTVTESVWRACYFEPRYKPSATQKRLVEAGHLGRKSGRGFYSYAEDAARPEASSDTVLANDIAHRIVTMLINEAADALYWGIASKTDIDLAMTTGVNYPKGLLAWADEIGIDHLVNTLDRLHNNYREERYRCSPLLRRMHENNETFYDK